MASDSENDPMAREYDRIEGSLKRILNMTDRKGYLTDYIILSTSQDVTDDGDLITNTSWHTNPKNGLAYHRMLGLIEYCRHLMIKEAVETED